MNNNKSFKDKVLKGIVDAFNEECRNYLYRHLAENGEESVWALLLVDYLDLYEKYQTEKYRRSVEALMTLIPDESRREVISTIKPDYFRNYFDKHLVIRILTNDFRSRYALENEIEANWGAGL